MDNNLSSMDKEVIAYYSNIYKAQIASELRLKKKAMILGLKAEQIESESVIRNRNEKIINTFLDWQQQKLGIDAHGYWELMDTTLTVEPSLIYTGPINADGTIVGYIPPVKNLIKTFSNSKIGKLPLIPNTVIRMNRAFWNCKNIRVYWGDSYPAYYSNIGFINNNDVDLTCTFFGCSNIEVAPLLPDNTRNLYSTFCGCTKLVRVAQLPKKLVLLDSTFKLCRSLEFLPPEIYKERLRIDNCTFGGCNTLIAKGTVIKHNYNYILNK